MTNYPMKQENLSCYQALSRSLCLQPEITLTFKRVSRLWLPKQVTRLVRTTKGVMEVIIHV